VYLFPVYAFGCVLLSSAALEFFFGRVMCNNPSYLVFSAPEENGALDHNVLVEPTMK